MPEIVEIIIPSDPAVIEVIVPGQPGPAGTIWDNDGWIDGELYFERVGLFHGDSSYRVIVEHIASEDNEPGVGDEWETYWEVIAGGTEFEKNWKSTYDPQNIVDDVFDLANQTGLLPATAIPDDSMRFPFVIRTRYELSFAEFTPVSNDQEFDNAPKIKEWLEEASFKKIPAIGIPGLFWTQPCQVLLQGDLHMKGPRSCIIKGMALSELPAVANLRIDGDLQQYFFRQEGFTFDSSVRDFGSAEASGSSCSLFKTSGYEISQCLNIGGYSQNPDIPSKGDSGWSINQCGPGWGHHNIGMYHPDKLVYITGGGSNATETDDWGDDNWSNNYIYRCNTAASSTRQTRRFIANHNFIMECLLGLGRTEAGSTNPARELIAIGNYMTRIGSRAFRLTAEGGDVVMGNVITDWGYNWDGVTPAVTQDAMRVEGASRSIVKGNIFRLRDWTKSNHQCISIRKFEFPTTGLVAYPTGNEITANIFSGAKVGIQETNDATDNYTNNRYHNIETPISGGTNSGSKHVIRETGQKERIRRNGFDYIGTWLPEFQIVGQTGVVTMTKQDGVYAFDGENMICHFDARATMTHVQDTGQLRILNLPFESILGGGRGHAMLGVVSGVVWPVGTVLPIAEIADGTDYIRFYLNGIGRNLQAQDISTGGLRIEGTVVYRPTPP